MLSRSCTGMKISSTAIFPWVQGIDSQTATILKRNHFIWRLEYRYLKSSTDKLKYETMLDAYSFQIQILSSHFNP